MAVKPKTPLPWVLPVSEDADIFALQALNNGQANPDQQQRVWRFIRETLCGCEIMSFWPGGEDGRRATDFAEGRRWVATQMRRLSRLKPRNINPRGAPPPMPNEVNDE